MKVVFVLFLFSLLVATTHSASCPDEFLKCYNIYINEVDSTMKATKFLKCSETVVNPTKAADALACVLITALADIAKCSNIMCSS